MRKYLVVLMLALGINYCIIGISNAVPPPLTSICEITAQILEVKEASSLPDSEDPGHKFYKIKLRILSIAGKDNPKAKPCKEAYPLDSVQEAIMLPSVYKKNPISEGFIIKSQIAMGVCCNERIGGNFLEDIIILDNPQAR